MKVVYGQTLLDIAIEYCGSSLAVYDLAYINGLSITDDLVHGQELILPLVESQSIVDYYKNKGIVPSTLITTRSQLIESAVDTIYRDIQSLQSNLISVMARQTILDIAIQMFGDAEAAYELATLNGLSLTEELVPGTLLQKATIVNKTIASYYSENKLTPATGIIAISESIARIFDNTFDFIFN